MLALAVPASSAIDNSAMAAAKSEPAHSAKACKKKCEGKGKKKSKKKGKKKGKKRKTKSNVLKVGISDNSPALFADTNFTQLGVRRARLIVPWNVALDPASVEYANASAWIAASLQSGVEASVAFSTDNYHQSARDKPPAVAAYKKAVVAFRGAFPEVRVFTPWNEANHITQPTAHYPERAARYYNTLKSLCRKCTVLGADVLDQTNTPRWLVRFNKAVKGAPRIWGLHNYSDVNKRRSVKSSYTGRMPKWVRGEIWATEAGGLVSFTTESGVQVYAGDQQQAAGSVKHLFSLLRSKSLRKRYTRVYVYQWFADPSSRWDSALINLDGSPRPSYVELQRQLNLPAIVG